MVNYKINVYLKHTEMENMYVREFIELVTQDINGNNFEFTVYEDDNVYDLTNKRVTMVVKSDSGTVIQENCQVVDAKRGKATITLPPDMLIENGPYMAEVQIWEGVNSRVTTLPFDYTVRLSLENDESIKADPRFSLLQVALQNVNDADGKSKEALKLSKEAKAICDDLVPKANTAAQNAQEALDRAESVVTQEELAQKVMLDGKDTKFDFIRQNIEQDGLVKDQAMNISHVIFINWQGLLNSNYLATCINTNKKGWGIYHHTVHNILSLYYSDGTDLQYVSTSIVPSNDGWLYAVVRDGSISIVSNTGSYNVQNINFTVSTIDTPYTFQLPQPAQEINIYPYNSINGQTIAHNVQVFSNSQAIKELHTTDSEGKTSILKLASDEDHVEMASGRTLREEYMGVLKTMGKESVSADGSPVEVNNGIEARVINAEIKGQTVKCISKLLKYTHDASTGRTKDVNLQLKKAKYTFSVEVTENVGNTILGFIFKDGASDVYKNIPINGVGFFKNVIDLSTCINNPRLYAIYATESGVSGSNKLVEQVNILYGEVNLITGLVDKGLSSTQAIVSNNGQQYPIYANEEDKANKKVISLGGVGDVKDALEILEDGSGIWLNRLVRVVLNGSENWSIGNTGTQNYYYQCTLPFGTQSGGVSDKYSFVTIGQSDINQGFYITGNSLVRVRYGTEKPLNDFKQDLSTNNLTIICILATPIVTHIPKELVPAILTNQTNILEAGGKVKASSFKVTVPVDKLAEIEARLQALESTTVDVVLNK
ncbi:BppU family phage baseplate upper protein [Zhenhengia sp.]|uniref:BppU family phage baseplate upper protein n=1 Tax=Zhenhengia sp. TaxID=2944208 RepID=UPI00307996A6